MALEIGFRSCAPSFQVFCVLFLLQGWWLARSLRAKRAAGLAPKTDEGGVGSPLVPPATAFAVFVSDF